MRATERGAPLWCGTHLSRAAPCRRAQGRVSRAGCRGFATMSRVAAAQPSSALRHCSLGSAAAPLSRFRDFSRRAPARGTTPPIPLSRFRMTSRARRAAASRSRSLPCHSLAIPCAADERHETSRRRVRASRVALREQSRANQWGAGPSGVVRGRQGTRFAAWPSPGALLPVLAPRLGDAGHPSSQFGSFLPHNF